jgi:hypothetical protein
MIMRKNHFGWAGNVSNFPREITETALAHYRRQGRAGILPQRCAGEARKLMEAWAGYCEPRRSANVVPMRGGKRS